MNVGPSPIEVPPETLHGDRVPRRLSGNSKPEKNTMTRQVFIKADGKCFENEKKITTMGQKCKNRAGEKKSERASERRGGEGNDDGPRQTSCLK